MENKHYPPNEESYNYLTIFIDPLIFEDFPILNEHINGFELVSLKSAKILLLKKDDKIRAQFPTGEFYEFPYYKKNILFLFQFAQSKVRLQAQETPAITSFLKAGEQIEKKLFSQASLNSDDIKDFWGSIIRKINGISAKSHTLSNLVEKILEIPFLQSFQTSIIVLHIKGQTKAEIVGSTWKSDKFTTQVEVKDFNQFFNSVKKSKIKSFSTDSFLQLNLPFNGSFLAKEITSKKYSLITIVSRHDFLSFGTREIELYETCIDLMQPHFERLIDQEFSDKKISELRVCLKDFPLPLRIKDTLTGSTFLNDLFTNELQDQDIFFNKKINKSFLLEIYDSDELRHYAFDLFHFQRISLLGELLNTLRHELSNPLFGLKLSTQIYNSIHSIIEDVEIMKEIEKNTDRCQTIIENFSNLYQTQAESKFVSIRKIIEESLTLSKSECKEVSRTIDFKECEDNLMLDIPVIFVIQILFNLIVNASQAMRGQVERASIELLVTRENSKIFIDVIDNGPGVPKQDASQLFKPFFTTKSQGTGLGLILSRNLALKIGGNLEYLVNLNKKGAQFRLTLPIS